MTREQVFTELDEIFQKVFDDDTIHVEEETTAADVEDWDSLEHINLVLAIEEHFGMKFSMGEITTMKNVGEMVTIILERTRE